MVKHLKHIFMDVDGTLTASRSKITPDIFGVLLDLRKERDVILVSGASREQMGFQMDSFPALYMAQNGNDTPYWKNEIKQVESDEIYQHIFDLRPSFTYEKDLLEHRGSQISLSMIGHHAPLDLKKAYDPDKKKRKALLKKFPFKSDKFDCVIAGTTCFDYFLKGMNKGHNIKRMLELKGWNSKDCLYIGDSLFKGGNDESVIGVIPVKKVKDEKETYKFLVNELKKVSA